VKARFWLAALVPAVLVGPVGAADLAKIDRTIAKEPAYQTKAPRYCLLVFGPQAKARVWLVLDGDTLYVDRKGNGDLTDPRNKVPLPEFNKLGQGNGPMAAHRMVEGGTIDVDPKLRQQLMLIQYKIDPATKAALVLGQEADLLKLLTGAPDGLITGLVLTAGSGAQKKESRPGAPAQQNESEPVTQVAFLDATGVLQFAARPQDAPIVHFDGPLQIALHPVQKLVHGQPSDLRVGIGTPGLGKGTFVMRGYEGVPKDAHPVVDIEFPHKDAGKPPIKLQVTLKERC
jgi:hypothetical protein